jgi:hypothetical protein
MLSLSAARGLENIRAMRGIGMTHAKVPPSARYSTGSPQNIQCDANEYQSGEFRTIRGNTTARHNAMGQPDKFHCGNVRSQQSRPNSPTRTNPRLWRQIRAGARPNADPTVIIGQRGTLVEEFANRV